MTKFTKDPWYIGGNTEYVNQLMIEPAIACVYGAGEEAKANARLLANAKKLFWLLKEVKDYQNQVFDDVYLLRVEALIKEIEGE